MLGRGSCCTLCFRQRRGSSSALFAAGGLELPKWQDLNWGSCCIFFFFCQGSGSLPWNGRRKWDDAVLVKLKSTSPHYGGFCWVKVNACSYRSSKWFSHTIGCNFIAVRDYGTGRWFSQQMERQLWESFPSVNCEMSDHYFLLMRTLFYLNSLMVSWWPDWLVVYSFQLFNFFLLNLQCTHCWISVVLVILPYWLNYSSAYILSKWRR